MDDALKSYLQHKLYCMDIDTENIGLIIGLFKEHIKDDSCENCVDLEDKIRQLEQGIEDARWELSTLIR